MYKVKKDNLFEFDAPKFNDFNVTSDGQDKWFDKCKMVDTPKDNIFQHSKLPNIIPPKRRATGGSGVTSRMITPQKENQISLKIHDTPKLQSILKEPGSTKIPKHLGFLKENSIPGSEQKKVSFGKKEYKSVNGKTKVVLCSPLKDISNQHNNNKNYEDDDINEILGNNTQKMIDALNNSKPTPLNTYVYPSSALKRPSTTSTTNIVQNHVKEQQQQHQQEIILTPPMSPAVGTQPLLASQVKPDQLPDKMEIRMDEEGRPYFVDHQTQTTSWTIAPESLKKKPQEPFTSPTESISMDSDDLNQQNLLHLFRDQQKLTKAKQQQKQQDIPKPKELKSKNQNVRLSQQLQTQPKPKIIKSLSLTTTVPTKPLNVTPVSTSTLKPTVQAPVTTLDTATVKHVPITSTVSNNISSLQAISNQLPTNVTSTVNSKNIQLPPTQPTIQPILTQPTIKQVPTPTLQSATSTATLKPTDTTQTRKRSASTISSQPNISPILPNDVPQPLTKQLKLTHQVSIEKQLSDLKQYLTPNKQPQQQQPQQQSQQLIKLGQTTNITTAKSNTTTTQPTIQKQPTVVKQNSTQTLEKKLSDLQQYLTPNKQTQPVQQATLNPQTKPITSTVVNSNNKQPVQTQTTIKPIVNPTQQVVSKINNNNPVISFEEFKNLSNQQNKRKSTVVNPVTSNNTSTTSINTTTTTTTSSNNHTPLDITQLQGKTSNAISKAKLLLQQQRENRKVQEDTFNKSTTMRFGSSSINNISMFRNQGVLPNSDDPIKVPKTKQTTVKRKSLTIPKSPYFLTNHIHHFKNQIPEAINDLPEPEKERLSVIVKKWKTENGLTRLSPFNFYCDRRFGSHSKRLIKLHHHADQKPLRFGITLPKEFNFATDQKLRNRQLHPQQQSQPQQQQQQQKHNTLTTTTTITPHVPKTPMEQPKKALTEFKEFRFNTDQRKR
ncbi:hypothetical protein DLAC_08774 [Tieghemostelium lacteum]|uniref:WW domain-containing protein n=1 Tax=Tieghemostelium lacteum TaxID=361077 RepID=A0A151Z8A0_TIELA|nr:hypothetical protein DLAC_08774 [Tieghemostelium lacteum]|eukprot:KYQ90180.1 hypothetical protein DLAC_08774 [Tieghemostelium lacteum]